jgi:hypothetical protein
MSEADPIRVYPRNGKWLIDYGSYSQGWYLSRSEAIEVATRAALDERRELTIEPEASAVISALPTGSQDGDWIRGPLASSSPSRGRLFFGHVDA